MSYALLDFKLHPDRFDALGSAANNLRVVGIRDVVELVNACKFREATDELERRCKVRVGPDFEVSEGLKRRRHRERVMFETGDYGELSPIPAWNGNPTRPHDADRLLGGP